MSAEENKGNCAHNSQNKRLVMRMFVDVPPGNPEAVLDDMADDVEFTLIGSTGISGVHKGKQAVIAQVLAPLYSRFADGRLVFTPELFVAEGNFVVMKSTGEAQTTDGRAYNNTYCHVIEVVDGKVRRLTEFLDTALLAEVLG